MSKIIEVTVLDSCLDCEFLQPHIPDAGAVRWACDRTGNNIGDIYVIDPTCPLEDYHE